MNKSYHFFTNEKKQNFVSIKEKKYKLETKEEMFDLLNLILMRKVELNQSERNELLAKIREMIGEIKI